MFSQIIVICMFLCGIVHSDIGKENVANELPIVDDDSDIFANNTSLHDVINNICQHSLKIIHKLLKRGYDVNTRDSFQRTPLHYAVQNIGKYNLDVVKFLIQKGAEVDARDNNGTTPLLYTARSCYNNNDTVEIAKELINHGADPVAADEKNCTVLHSITLTGFNLDIADLVLDRGADPNVADVEGNTPYTYSVVTYTSICDWDYIKYNVKHHKKETVKLPCKWM